MSLAKRRLSEDIERPYFLDSGFFWRSGCLVLRRFGSVEINDGGCAFAREFFDYSPIGRNTAEIDNRIAENAGTGVADNDFHFRHHRKQIYQVRRPHEVSNL